MKKPIILVLGTSSGAGKTTVAAAICRILTNAGLIVRPFKAFNMSLNSLAADDGSEIARSQWLQAQACRSSTSWHNNPVLVKPEGNGRSMLILRGKVAATGKYREISENWLNEEKSAVVEAINYLSNESDVIIAEGSGSPAEINMFDRDIANTFLLENFDLAGILVADIERGGAYASIAGTISLMKHSEKVRWIAINKMHGDVSLVESANKEIYNITGKPVIGTIPFHKYYLPGEDMMDYLTEERRSPEILLIKYPHWENYSDIDSLSYYAGITYITSPIRTLFENCSLIILPGSKNVLEDLRFLRSVGLDKLIIEFSGSKKVIGLCGGYQILGRIISGPTGTEVEDTQVNGLGLLECQTNYERKKTVKPVTYKFHQSTGILSEGKGYEIHYGSVTTAENPLLDVNGELEGSVSRRGNIFGTNVHGILENREFLSYLLSRKLTGNYSDHIEEQIELLSKNVRNSLDLSGLISYAHSGQIP